MCALKAGCNILPNMQQARQMFCLLRGGRIFRSPVLLSSTQGPGLSAWAAGELRPFPGGRAPATHPLMGGVDGQTGPSQPTGLCIGTVTGLWYSVSGRGTWSPGEGWFGRQTGCFLTLGDLRQVTSPCSVPFGNGVHRPGTHWGQPLSSPCPPPPSRS